MIDKFDKKQSKEESEEEEFMAEKIVKKRLGKNGKPEYFVKWKGYPDEENT